jgi:hypothetical protein
MTTSSAVLRRALSLTVSVVAIASCTEPNRKPVASATASPVLEARLDLSDSTPRAQSEIDVRVQLRGEQSGKVASFTARLPYDTTALRFVGEATISDGATRIANPQPGLLRIAGIAPQGFKDGLLYVVRFSVVRPEALSSLRLLVDEMHSTGRADVSPALSSRAP